MNAFFQTLKPTPLCFIFIFLGLVVQGLFCSTSSTTFSLASPSPTQTVQAFGLGTPIQIATVNETTTTRIRWLVLALNLAVVYGLGCLAATGLAKLTRLPRPATAYGLVAAAMLLITFFISISISKIYWGYFFFRPGLLTEVSEIANVQAIIPFVTDSDESGLRRIAPEPDQSLPEWLAAGKKYGAEGLDTRVLVELDRRKLLPTAFASTFNGLPELYPLIVASGILAASSPGYDSARNLNGLIVNATNKSGDRIVLLCFRGGQVSNDHYPYYELLFRGPPDSFELSPVTSIRFFYDAAGMEGFEWYVILIFLAIPGILVGFTIFTVARIVRNWRSRRTAV
jgi:hypothetical protein